MTTFIDRVGDHHEVGRSADISPDGRYRYRLTRTWNTGLPRLGWIMLNPSTADADVDDPTIRRCMRFADREGYGSIVVRNLYALRATQPAEVFKVHWAEAVGPENPRQLHDACGDKLTVCAWGVLGAGVGPAVMDLLAAHGAALAHLGLTIAGHPKHPLYLRADAPMVRWNV